MDNLDGLTLGDRMALTQADEACRTAASAERTARAHSEEALETFQRVQDFFEKAKSFFTAGIQAARPTRELFLMVGQEYRGKGDNTDVYSILGMHSNITVDGTPQPRLVAPGNAYHALWEDFVQWCTSNGLKARWEYCWDGGGMSSWFTLGVEPLKGLPDAPVFANPNNVLRQHSHCLHVLQATVQGLLQAEQALKAVCQSGDDTHQHATGALASLGPLLESVRAVDRALTK